MEFCELSDCEWGVIKSFGANGMSPLEVKYFFSMFTAATPSPFISTLHFEHFKCFEAWPLISLKPQSGHFGEVPLGSTFTTRMPLSKHFSRCGSKNYEALTALAGCPQRYM